MIQNLEMHKPRERSFQSRMAKKSLQKSMKSLITSIVMGVKTKRLERSKPRLDNKNPSWYLSIDDADLHG